VDHDEAEHLRSENRRLRQSAARWRAVAALLAAVVGVLLLAGAVAGLLLGRAWADRQREQAEREELVEMLEREADESRSLAVEQSKQALALLERLDRRDRARDQADALAPVAGGLAVAALGESGEDR
jgi:hypothetical protein